MVKAPLQHLPTCWLFRDSCGQKREPKWLWVPTGIIEERDIAASSEAWASLTSD